MRTTVELPPELLRAAKARSAESGESLKTLLTRAVAAELQVHRGPVTSKGKVALPLFGDPAGQRVRLTNSDIERALADADVERTRIERPVRRRKRS
jgi:hypothetical protein